MFDVGSSIIILDNTIQGKAKISVRELQTGQFI